MVLPIGGDLIPKQIKGLAFLRDSYIADPRYRPFAEQITILSDELERLKEVGRENNTNTGLIEAAFGGHIA